MKNEEAVKIARELVERFNTKIEHVHNETYVVLYKELLFTEDIKTLMPYFDKYFVAIYADGTSKLRVSIR